MEIKLEGSSVEYYRGFVGSRVDMVSGLLVLGVDELSVAVVVARSSALRPGVRCYWVVRE